MYFLFNFWQIWIQMFGSNFHYDRDKWKIRPSSQKESVFLNSTFFYFSSTFLKNFFYTIAQNDYLGLN